MSPRLRRIAVTVLIIAAVVGAFFYATRPEPIPVELHTVGKGLVESTVANTRAGTVTACRRAKMAPPTGGQVARLDVTEGDKVSKGQVLLELWNEDLAAQVKLAESQVQASQARAEEACFLAEQSQREADRLVKLKAKGLASDEDVDKAVANAKAKNASCRAARADVDVNRAQLEVARAALDRTRLKAPFVGTVAEINGEVGEFVTPSPTGVQTPPAVDLIDNSCVYVTAPIDEFDAPAVKPGMPARITLDAFTDRRFQAIVQRVAPYVQEVEQQARTVDVEAVFADPSVFQELLPGYSADVEIILDVHQDVTRVPTEAVLEGPRVLVYRAADERLEARAIETGLANWQYTEVTAGVRAGEQIAVSVGREGVGPGAYVVPE